MIKLFLDSFLKFAIESPDSLTLYTQEMADEMDELLAGVVVDEDEWTHSMPMHWMIILVNIEAVKDGVAEFARLST